MAIASVAGVGKEHIEVSVTAGSAVLEMSLRGEPTYMFDLTVSDRH